MESSLQMKELTDFINDVKTTDAVNYRDKIVVVTLGHAAKKNAKHIFMPIQLNAFSILLATAGELYVTIDYKSYTVKKNMLYTLIERHIINDVSASEDFRGFHIVVEHDFFKEAAKEEKPPLEGVVNAKRVNPIIELAEKDFEILINRVQKLRYNIQRSEHSYQEKMIKNDLANLAFDIWDFMMQRINSDHPIVQQSTYEEIAFRFFNLLFKYYMKEHEVSFYADQLNISPIYLSRVIKQVTGKTTIKVISDILLMESKILLRNQKITIQQVADKLNFSDQASFSKFFKKHTGVPPLEYRRKINN